MILYTVSINDFDRGIIYIALGFRTPYDDLPSSMQNIYADSIFMADDQHTLGIL